MTTQQKNEVLDTLAQLLSGNKQAIIEANQQDIALCVNIDSSLLDRLKVDEAKIDGLIVSLRQAISLEDPEGKILYTHLHENGMRIENRAVPFGKILIIYESRPDVTIEAAITAFKAGNRLVLKGGKEARITNLFFVQLWHQALASNGIDPDYVVYFDGNREEVQQLIRENTHRVDLIIPRGGEELIRFVTQHTNVPVLVSGRGNNFLYIDQEADFDMAIRLVLNGKKRVSVCNALDKVLIHRNTSADKIQRLIAALTAASIQLIGDTNVCRQGKAVQAITHDAVWSEEFLSAKILLALVDDAEQAIHTINRYSGGHSACIVTTNTQLAFQFQTAVDCAAVYHNASTRFTDGNQFGFSAEIAISTQKLHFRGPVGIAQLVTNKWFVSGNGQTRE